MPLNTQMKAYKNKNMKQKRKKLKNKKDEIIENNKGKTLMKNIVKFKINLSKILLMKDLPFFSLFLVSLWLTPAIMG